MRPLPLEKCGGGTGGTGVLLAARPPEHLMRRPELRACGLPSLLGPGDGAGDLSQACGLGDRSVQAFWCPL